MAAESFWDKRAEAQKVVDEVSEIKRKLQPLRDCDRQLEDLKVLIELGEAEEYEGQKAALTEAVEMSAKLGEEIETLEIQFLLNGPHDHSNPRIASGIFFRTDILRGYVRKKAACDFCRRFQTGSRYGVRGRACGKACCSQRCRTCARHRQPVRYGNGGHVRSRHR